MRSFLILGRLRTTKSTPLFSNKLQQVCFLSITARTFTAEYKPLNSKMGVARDPTTLSNYDAWRTQHTTANFTIDFAAKCLRGSVVLELESQTDGTSKEILLDSSHVDVSSVKVNGSPSTEWKVLPRTEPNGSPLQIAVPEGAAKGETIKLEISLATTDKCTALQWLTPAQTSNGKAPFMFSQAQAIHARSLFPCQDTPDVKSTYDFNITSPYVVVASGVAVPKEESSSGSESSEAGKLYQFQQKVPIPSYLFAVASGDIATAPIGRQSVVATGPNELEASQCELALSVRLRCIESTRSNRFGVCC
jgi:leukotriene-A4 hydrolase